MKRKPHWLKIKSIHTLECNMLRILLRKYKLYTVCEGAHCPNIGECWSNRTATFMILGSVCTRNCRFCAVKSSNRGTEINLDEPKNLAHVVKELALRYVTITSVDRDDLPDRGSEHFANCVQAIKNETNAIVEILIPDYMGCDLRKVVNSGPDVIGHNIEVVKRLTPHMRDARASYERSLQVLKDIKDFNSNVLTKSSLMLGLGECENEIFETMDDLLRSKVDILTIGQYLQPTKKNAHVVNYVEPIKFEEYRKLALKKGFKAVVSGPLVRSSYKAEECFRSISSQAIQ